MASKHLFDVPSYASIVREKPKSESEKKQTSGFNKKKKSYSGKNKDDSDEEEFLTSKSKNERSSDDNESRKQNSSENDNLRDVHRIMKLKKITHCFGTLKNILKSSLKIKIGKIQSVKKKLTLSRKQKVIIIL